MLDTSTHGGTYHDGDYYYDGCGFASEAEYNTAKKKMLKSVYQNGGFWIGRYEAGINSPRTSSGDTTLPALSQQNKYPYIRITCSQAQLLASKMSVNSNVTSSLMFGIQWQLVCKFLGNNATSLGDTISERKSKIRDDSTSWGNYRNSHFDLDRGQFSTDTGKTWNSYTSNTKKSSNSRVLLTTGASDRNKVLNIYDFAGNVWEFTLARNYRK